MLHPQKRSTAQLDDITAAPAPASALKKKTFKRTELEDDMYLQPDEVRRFFAAVTNRRDRAIFRVVYHHRLRASEIRLLQLSDYRDRDELLYVRSKKGSVSRDCGLIPEEHTALRAYTRLDRGRMPGPLFPSRQGMNGISRSRLDQLMKMYCVKAGIRPEKAHMHAWKHSCGTHLAERGNEARAIKDWLGHKDSASTDIYMHFSKRLREESIARNRDWK